MKNYKIAITDAAERDLLGAYYYLYFELRNPMAAEKFKTVLQEKINTLSEAPYMGETFELVPEYRIAHAYRHRIFYFVDENDNTVVVSKVFYVGRDNPRVEDLQQNHESCSPGDVRRDVDEVLVLGFLEQATH